MIHELGRYWAYIGGNVASMPAQGALAVAFAVCFRKPAAAWWHRHFGARADLREIRAVAEDARRIAADLFEHVTDRPHPAAPKAAHPAPPPYRPDKGLITYIERGQEGPK